MNGSTPKSFRQEESESKLKEFTQTWYTNMYGTAPAENGTAREGAGKGSRCSCCTGAAGA